MDGAWCISDEDHIDTTEIYCTTLCRVNDPIEIPASNVWLVYDEGEGAHINGKVTIRKINIFHIFFVVAPKVHFSVPSIPFARTYNLFLSFLKY